MSEFGQTHPCVIVSNDMINFGSPTVTAIPITSKDKRPVSTRIALDIEDVPIYGTALVEQMRVVDKKRIGIYLGKLSENTMKKIESAMLFNLNLHMPEKTISAQESSGFQVMNIDGVECFEKDGTAYLKLETVARGLGFTDSSKSVEYVRWNTVRQYLNDIGFSQEVAKDGFIPENVFYRLAMKAKNEASERFQAKVADEIIPSIRKTGGYGFRQMTPEEMMRVQLGMIDKHEERISKLENCMNIDYSQQVILEKAVGEKVTEVLGGKQKGRLKVFAECNYDIRTHFHVNSRNNIPKSRFNEAIEFIDNWKPVKTLC